jgi:outer membrane lipoprotein carrier protein
MNAWLVAVTLVSFPLIAHAQSADQVVADVEKFYANTTQATARFEQLYTNAAFGTKEPSAGTLYVQRPGKMRWDYDAKRKGQKPRKNFIADGKTFYYVDHVNKSVQQYPLAGHSIPVAISFLHGQGNLAKDFTATIDASGTYGTKKQIVLALAPKQPSAAYKQLYLVVDPTDFHVVKTVIVESSDNVNELQFLAPDFTTPIAASQFTLDKKQTKGYKISKPRPTGSPSSPPSSAATKP